MVSFPYCLSGHPTSLVLPQDALALPGPNSRINSYCYCWQFESLHAGVIANVQERLT